MYLKQTKNKTKKQTGWSRGSLPNDVRDLQTTSLTDSPIRGFFAWEIISKRKITVNRDNSNAHSLKHQL